MDINDLRSAISLVSLLAFAALAAWAWWPANRSGFDAAARLPLEDDPIGGEQR